MTPRVPIPETLFPRIALQLSLRAVSRILAAACLAFVLAACGGSDTPKATPSPAQTEAPAATSAADVDANRCPRAEDPGTKTAPKLDAPDDELDDAKTYVATVTTNCGAFEITLDAKRAPKTGGSFKFLADQGFYDGLLIHRIVPGFVFQGGDPDASGKGGPGYSITEKPPENLKYTKYVVAMAKGSTDEAGSSGSQFFVATGPDAEKLPPEYALLGKVTGGTGVVDKIGAIITDPRSDFPEDPVLIESIEVGKR